MRGRWTSDRTEGCFMTAWITGMKVFSWVVVALMLLAILYALGISLTHWSAIAI